MKTKTHNDDGSPILPPTSQHHVGGHCGKCGAPWFQYSGPWWGVVQPSPEPSCNCWNRNFTTTNNTLDIKYK